MPAPSPRPTMPAPSPRPTKPILPHAHSAPAPKPTHAPRPSSLHASALSLLLETVGAAGGGREGVGYASATGDDAGGPGTTGDDAGRPSTSGSTHTARTSIAHGPAANGHSPGSAYTATGGIFSNNSPHVSSSPNTTPDPPRRRPSFLRSASNPSVRRAEGGWRGKDGGEAKVVRSKSSAHAPHRSYAAVHLVHQGDAGQLDDTGAADQLRNTDAASQFGNVGGPLAVEIPSSRLFEAEELLSPESIRDGSRRPATAESQTSSQTDSKASHADSKAHSRASHADPKAGAHRPAVRVQDPRDHALLEHIYNEMHAERWVNLAPLSLLANALPLHFKDVRTHPPIMFMFPPHAYDRVVHRRAPSKGKTKEAAPHLGTDTETSCLSDCSEGEDQSDSEWPRGAPRGMDGTDGTPSPARDAPHHAGEATLTNGHAREYAQDTLRAPPPVLPTEGVIRAHEILRETQPFVALDATAPGVSFAATTASRLGPLSAPEEGSVNRLPNKTLAFDLQSLNLHLSTRVTEIIACREAMWEWVGRWRETRRGRRGREREREPGPFGPELLEMTRADFDALLRRFEMDMQDSIALDARLQDTFAWSRPAPGPRTPERRAFEQACARWDEHVRGLPQGAPERRRERARLAGQRLSRTIRVFCAWK
ncbi:hypothetical protein K488DRAFT_81951 [Vararia minispora EC-137]|uniref:Uncharacterized protein n=1 Tax=Vararia minispora EC-137 TaxID=1314806 RepID=A0ACB8QXX5_9AGAM|nr:hypothetical protein K488DRAFT_81951 [Vararia minispora EC-137]